VKREEKRRRDSAAETHRERKGEKEKRFGVEGVAKRAVEILLFPYLRQAGSG
jgi:hypothetical protein